MYKVRYLRGFALLLLGVSLAATGEVMASIEQLDRGHRILIEKGMQIQAHTPVYPTVPVDPSRFVNSNFTTVNFANSGDNPDVLAQLPGIGWP